MQTKSPEKKAVESSTEREIEGGGGLQRVLVGLCVPGWETISRGHTRLGIVPVLISQRGKSS